MKKTKRCYINKDGNMIGYTKGYYAPDKIEIPVEPFSGKLRIIDIGYLNSGFYIKLQDENGKQYSMNNVMFSDYITQNDVFLEGDWCYYQQGTSFSIGLNKDDDD